MLYNNYIGNNGQLYGVDELRLESGRADGMKMLAVRTIGGLEFLVSADRCADIPRLSYKGVNIGFFSPCGFSKPEFFNAKADNFLDNFTAGFLTTCGLSNVGIPCTDDGESLCLHGTIANTPCTHIYWQETENDIVIKASVIDGRIFSRKLRLERTITCPKDGSTLTLSDTISNEGEYETPLMLLYHINFAYPFLCEKTRLDVNSINVKARDARAQEGIDSWMEVCPPTPGFTEQCYCHTFAKDSTAKASLYNPELKIGATLSFSPEQLDCFTQWKMNGIGDYVLGLEPSNCTVMGRAQNRADGTLKFLAPGESVTKQVKIEFISIFAG